MILSRDAGKAFDKIQHPLLIKTLKKVGIEGLCLNTIEAIYEKPTAAIVVNGEQRRALPEIRDATGMSPLTTVV